MDGRVERAVHSFVLHHRWIASLSRWLTHLGDPLVVTAVTLLLAALLWWRRDRRAAVFVVATRLIALAVDVGTKDVVRRARPVLAHPFASAHGYSFPSGHALGSAALWASIAVVAHWRGLLRRGPAAAAAIVVPVVVATTRVLLGVHFPTDVLAGLALGWACAFVAWWFILKGARHVAGPADASSTGPA